MFNRKYVILLLFSLLCMLAISSVSADDVPDSVDAEMAFDDASDEIISEVPSQDDSGDGLLGDAKQANAEIHQDGNYYKNTTINVVVKDNQTNEGIEGAMIYLEFSNGKNATITTHSGGMGSYDINFDAGTYSVTASSLDTDVAIFSPVTLNDISILPHSGKITITQSGKYADNKVLTVKVYDQFTNNGFAQKVYLDFSNGKKTFVRTNADGIATYKMNFKPGTYWVKASATNNNVELNEVKLSNVVISRTPVYLNPRPYAAFYASGKNFMVKVKNYNYKPAVGVKVKIDIYTGKKKVSVYRRTNDSGWAQYPASKLAIGKHKVVVSVASNDLHAGKLKATTITIKKANMDIYAPSNVQVAQNYDGKYGVKLTNRATGDPIANMNVQFKVFTDGGYKVFNVKTSKTGYACIQTKGYSIGKHDVVVSAGNNYYNVAQKTGYFVTSDRVPTYLQVSASSGDGDYSPKIGGYNAFWILLHDMDHNQLKGKELIIIDSKGTKKITFNNNDPVWTVHFNSNFTSCSISFAGDNDYLPCKCNLSPIIHELMVRYNGSA